MSSTRRGGDNPRERIARDVDDELSFHRERTIGELMEAGMNPSDAERVAARRFGLRDRYRRTLIVHALRQHARLQRRAAMEAFASSMRSVLRSAYRSPGFVLGVISVLTLGLGVNAITFALVDRLILSGPAEITDSRSLYRVAAHRRHRSGAEMDQTELAYADYRELLRSTQLAGAAAESSTPLLLGSGESAEIVQARLVTANYFSLLGVTPALGRFFTSDESELEGAHLVVLSHAYWSRRFGASPDVIGQVLPIESNRYTVVGIAPRRFTGTAVSKVDVFLPLEAAAEEQISGQWRTGFSLAWIAPIVRLPPGTTTAAVIPPITAAYRESRRGTKDEDPAARLMLEPLNAVAGATAGDEMGVAALLWAVALLVLAIAAANVANLFFARALRHSDQLALRLALGAARWRLILEQTCEGALLALIGAVIAVAVAMAGTPLVQRLLFPGIDWLDTAVDVRGLLFIAMCAVAGGATAASLPMWRATRHDLLMALRGGPRVARTRSRVQSAMLLVQAAMSVLLLVGAGLFVKSLEMARTDDLGIDSRRLMIVSAAPGETPLRPEFRDEWRRRVDTIPGVERTTRSAGTVPFVSSWAVKLTAPDLASLPSIPGGGPYIAAVEPGYFETVGTRISRGRGFTSEDRDGAARVAIVNESMARLYWPGHDAIGKCLLIGPSPSSCTTIVGIAQNTRREAIVEGDSMLYYIPLDQSPPDLRSRPRLIVRIADDSPDTFGRIAEAARRAALAVEPGLRVVNARALDDLIAPQLRAWRLGASLFSVFGLLALVVAAVGLYSVIAFDVEGRRREMGVRSALGASAASILQLIVRDGLRMAAAGIIVGLALATALAPLIARLLYRVKPLDVSVFGGVAVALVAAALIATAIPALRAAQVNPSDALRDE